MSSPFGDGDEMREQGKWLTEKEAERLLDGIVPADRPDLVPVADRLGSLAQAFEASGRSLDVRALAAIAASETRLIPSEKGDPAATPASKANRPARQVSGLPKRRNPVLNAIIAFVATTAGKVTVVAALTSAAATGGLAATDNLPVLQDGNDPPAVTVVDESDALDEELDELEDEASDDVDAVDEVDAIDEVDEVDEVEPCEGLEGAAHETCEDQLDDHESDDVDEADEVDDHDDESDEVDDHDDESDEVDDHDAEDESDDADEVDEVDEADDHDAEDSADEADEADD
jgi:hypothetical protein